MDAAWGLLPYIQLGKPGMENQIQNHTTPTNHWKRGKKKLKDSLYTFVIVRKG